MECVYLDLGGGDRWNYWKVRCLAENIRLGIRKSLENIWFEIRKILDISGIINWWVVVDLTLLLLYIASATFAGSSKNVRISIGAGDF